MALDVGQRDFTLAVVGCGVMGQGIAQIAAAAGCRVLMFDAKPGAAEAAKAAIGIVLAKLAERGKMSAAQSAATLAQLCPVALLTDLAPARIAVEAIVESLEAKRALVRELEGILAAEAVIATNTSSLSVTAIAAAVSSPGRVAGFHFFNPVPLMKVVEVIDGALTAPWVAPVLSALAERMGHRAVRAKDTPGFLVNHAGRGYGTEALRILGENVAEPAVIDTILKGACGFRMGPFELLDLTGLDVSQPVMESIYRQFYEEPRFRPSPITAQRLAGGLLGRKTKRGFYDHSGTPPAAEPQPAGPLPASAWIADGPNRDAIAAIVGAAGVALAAKESAALRVLPLLGEDASSAAHRLALDPRRCVGVDGLFGLASHRTLVATPATDGDARSAALALFTRDGKPASLVSDSPGAVAQRVLATIVNIASDIAQQRIATPGDIDAAVTLGLGYPQGPLAWGDAIGARTILAVLEAMLAITGDPRYRPSLWLRRRALLGLSLMHPEA